VSNSLDAAPTMDRRPILKIERNLRRKAQELNDSFNDGLAVESQQVVVIDSGTSDRR
jgi:hypothetical protein